MTAPEPTEDQLNETVARLLELAFHGRPVAWTHFPAGGYALTRAAQARLKRHGFQPGYPDLLIQWPVANTVWIELKTRTGVLSRAQQECHARLTTIGFRVYVCRSLEDVLKTLKGLGVPMNSLMMR